MRLSLINFNTLGTPHFAPDIAARYQKMCEKLNKEKADVICLQEVATYYHLFLLKRYLKYPYMVYQKFIQGPKGGLVIISQLPIEKIKYKNFPSLSSFKDISFFSHIIRNGILIAKVKDKSIVIFNTHTFTDFEFEWSPSNKLYRFVKTHIEELITEVNSFANKTKSILIAGDFNIKKNSRLYKTFLQKTKAIDVFRQFSFPTYYQERLNYKFKGKTSERIDFIFLKDLQKKSKILSRDHMFDKEEKLSNNKISYLSDHIGLKANFDIV